MKVWEGSAALEGHLNAFQDDPGAYLLQRAVCFTLHSHTACTGFLHCYGAVFWFCVVVSVCLSATRGATHVLHSAVRIPLYSCTACLDDVHCRVEPQAVLYPCFKAQNSSAACPCMLCGGEDQAHRPTPWHRPHSTCWAARPCWVCIASSWLDLVGFGNGLTAASVHLLQSHRTLCKRAQPACSVQGPCT